MKSNKSGLFLSVIVLVTAFGCKHEFKQVDYFPNSVGYYWFYNVFDSVLNKSEPLRVSIVDNRTINGANSAVWLLSYTNRTDTFFVSQSKDTIIFNSNSFIKRIYVVPFSLNQIWNESYFSTNNSKVISIEDVTVPAGSFNDTYVIERNIRSFNYSLYEKIYFKPQIGIVKLYTKEYNLGPVQIKTWELKSFDYSNPTPL
ncbi:MAG: hypothetical protein P4L34_02290 [Paludibacter sp.]|nr:hypothetical protein [Paludibacter sp.]